MLKRLFVFLLIFSAFGLISFFLFIPSPDCATQNYPQDSGWEIAQYDVALDLRSDGSLRIREEIIGDFLAEGKHGIYRFVPLLFIPNLTTSSSAALPSPISISDMRVWQNGKPAQYETTRTRNPRCDEPWWATEFNENISYKIGSPDVTLNPGKHTYLFEYTVRQALRRMDGKVTLYWNAIGTQWGVPISQSRVSVLIPDGVKFLEADCFTGVLSSTERSCSLEVPTDATNKLVVETTEQLTPGEGLTILTKFSGSTEQLARNVGGEPRQWIVYALLTRWWTFLPLLIVGYASYVYFRHGRPVTARDTITPQFYPPSGISPAAAGTVSDQSVDNVDISSIIISLAVKGHLKIIQTQKQGFLTSSRDYIFEKTHRANAQSMSQEEQYMYDGLFASGRDRVQLSDLKYQFADTLQNIKESLQDQAVRQGYFSTRPGLISEHTSIPALTLAVNVVAAVVIGSPWLWMTTIISILLCGLIFFMFNYYTPSGKELRANILGLRMYMATAEKDRIEFHNAPEKTPERFETLLPYAMALGVVDIWTRAFDGVLQSPPEWYSGVALSQGFLMSSFASDLQQASSSFASTITAVKNSSSSGGGGGGFSGGGGGGGGGGSW
jgi:uncharacterized membrane protein YgcG